MTEVVAGGAAAEGRSAGAAVDYGGIAGVGRSGGYRQSRRIGTGDPGRGCGFGAGAGFVADAGGDSHLMNSAWIATSQEGRQNVGRIEDRGTQRASRELEDRAAGRLEGEEGGGGGDVGDGVPGQAVVVAVALGDGRRGRRKRNCLDLGKPLHLRWHWHSRRHSKDWAGPGCLDATTDRSTPAWTDYWMLLDAAGYAEAEGPLERGAGAGGLPHQSSTQGVAAQQLPGPPGKQRKAEQAQSQSPPPQQQQRRGDATRRAAAASWRVSRKEGSFGPGVKRILLESKIGGRELTGGWAQIGSWMRRTKMRTGSELGLSRDLPLVNLSRLGSRCVGVSGEDNGRIGDVGRTLASARGSAKGAKGAKGRGMAMASNIRQCYVMIAPREVKIHGIIT
ncbi:hypothetical protein GLAREA_01802 [Glarea lozoyensis ATCC 20868]|uniref:Uncharacterized protein n=1 Tax=Glarea lozoyensis (strain ATCC 20868 / MF5171) TaxID=1116229 RepID=S3CJB5_GLAL2|nr:uncharacterized protein GLAREA_01802 [Glarea lozoyensis ATCC 20868]EPE25890.1 hypothetical protein GLAREA_01802 [Glarea lozoyensis ATCC 20868]